MPLLCMLGIPVVSCKNEDEIVVFIRREWKKYPGGGMGFKIPGLGRLKKYSFLNMFFILSSYYAKPCLVLMGMKSSNRTGNSVT